MTTLNSKCRNRRRHPSLYNAERFFVCRKCYITYVTWALVICLICPHSASGSCVHIRQITPAYVTYITYGGKLWRWETLANLANDSQFAKFIPAKFYPIKESLT